MSPRNHVLATCGCTLVLKLSDSIKMGIRNPRDVRETSTEVAGTCLVVIVFPQAGIPNFFSVLPRLPLHGSLPSLGIKE